MFGLLCVHRILRCAGRVGSTEALLLSVLQQQQQQQSVAFPKTDRFPSLEKLPECEAPTHSEVGSARLAAQAEPSPTSPSEDYRLFFDLLNNSATFLADLPQHHSRSTHHSSSPSEMHTDGQRPLSLGTRAAIVQRRGKSENEDLCFTLAAAEFDSDITFPEILAQWELFVEKYGVSYTEQLSPNLCRREAALLNSKLEDPVLGQLTAMKSAAPLLKSVSHYIADVLQSDRRRMLRDQHTGDADVATRASPTLACYGLPHFSAELGDVAYLQSLLRQYPRGFPMRWLSSAPGTFPAAGATERASADKSCRTMNLHAAEGRESAFGQSYSRASEQPAALQSFEQVATEWPDHFGLYLSHLAALNGHVGYLQFLTNTLGKRFVLREQQCAPPVSSFYSWGTQRYTTGLTAAQCAVAAHQVTLLEWIEATYPAALHHMRPRGTLDALTIAAMSKDDRTDVFDFFVSRSMPPLDVLRAKDKEETSVKRTSVRGGAVGVYDEALQDAGILRLVFAAAEVGNVSVLRWFDEALGSRGVRELCDAHGVTILHHCARGRNTELLEVLLPPSATDCDVASSPKDVRWSPLDPLWVDVEDDQGRTPAMWCVMSAKRSKSAIDTLEVLRKAGSNWPRQRRDGMSLLDVATRSVSRHSKLVRYIKTHVHASGAYPYGIGI